ncbi:MAG: insulinase family protein [Planctomycetota bacterium]|nr:insulinase family protein [Planctomycetota bacterium]
MLPALLQHGTAAWPDRPALARAKERAFAAQVGSAMARHAESSIFWLHADAVAGDFLPGRPDQLAEVLSLLQEYALRPRLASTNGGAEAFPEEVFEREQAQALAAARAVFDDKGAYARQQAVQAACEGEPYGLSDHGGEDAIKALDAAAPASMLRDFRDHGERVCVAMGVLPDNFHEALAPLLGQLQATEPGQLAAPVEPARREPRSLRESAPMQQAKLVLVLRSLRAREPEQLCALQTCLSLWGGGPHSRLFREVRENKSLCYYASAGGDPNKGLVMVQVGCEGDSVGAVVDESMQQLTELQEGRFEDAELATTKAAIDGSLQAVDDSPGSRLHFTTEQWLRGFDDDPVTRRQRFARVTREDVAEAARSIWLDYDYALLPEETRS